MTARNGHVGSLDGMRALAIAAVIAYHADFAAVPGGFLGVECFFVLSGFLVTRALLAELGRNGRISLRSFARRRARRLAPGLFVMLATVSAVVVLSFPDQVSHLRRGAVGALTGTSNWLELTNGDYFATFGRGPVLRHLWSFAVELQAYAILPCLLSLIWVRTKRHADVAIALGLFTLAGYGWQAYVAIRHPGTSRPYFGTDSRIAAVFAGRSSPHPGPQVGK